MRGVSDSLDCYQVNFRVHPETVTGAVTIQVGATADCRNDREHPDLRDLDAGHRDRRIGKTIMKQRRSIDPSTVTGMEIRVNVEAHQ